MTLSERVRRQLRYGVLCLIALGGLGVQAAFAQKRSTVPGAEFPAAVRTAILAKFSDAQISTVEKEMEGPDAGQLDIRLKSAGKEYNVKASADGTIKEALEQGTTASSVAAEEGKKNSSFMTWGLVVLAVGVLWWGFKTKKAPPNPRAGTRR